MTPPVIESRHVAETLTIAQQLCQQYPPPMVYALHGPLGSGKTCFVQGLALALGIADPVLSPTFTLIREYRRGAVELVHVDLYRLHDPEALATLGLEEIFDREALVAVEWAERAAADLPARCLHVRFEPVTEEEHRRLTVTPPPTTGDAGRETP